MKPYSLSFGKLSALIASLLLLAQSAWAAPVIATAVTGPNTPSTLSDELAYAAVVSSTDLLHGNQGTGGTWGANGSNPNYLTDGLNGGDCDASGLSALVGAAWAKDGSTLSFRSYNLGTGLNGLGYDITGIQSIAGWQGAGFMNQRYQIYISTIAVPSYTLLASVNYQPADWVSGAAANTKGGATKVNVTDSTGLLATGVVGIRFDFLDTDSHDNGGVVMREIDVFGVPSNDENPPSIISIIPADNTPNVSPSGNLVATFSENIVLGTGTITIKNLDTLSETVITLPDARVSASGAVLTINPSSNLATNSNYALRIAAGAITDVSGNPFGGISNETTWNFITGTASLRIMCLGDSITAGYTDNPSWANHPFKFGYRSGLYTRLTNAGYNFLFVGASSEPWSATQNGDPTYGGTYKPALDLRDVGQDGHRGYGGSGIWGNVNGWIATDGPDVILLMIGINGIGSGSPAALNNLVNSIVTTAPDVHLIIAQITPRSTFNQSIYNYNVYIRDTLVPNYMALGKKVSTVNMYSLFLSDPNNYASAIAPNVLANGINHPDNPHYDLMAQEWFEGIEALGLGPDTFADWISNPSFAVDPAEQGITQDPDGDGIKNGVENFFGTDPGEFSSGVSAGIKNGTSFTFTHPQNATPATNLSAFYQWSKDLEDYHASGATDGDETTVIVTALPNNPSPGITTVTAQMSGTLSEKLFLKVGVLSD